nr:PREDICTED: uncharacterized protein LOC109039470 [Bemisia tabaci]
MQIQLNKFCENKLNISIVIFVGILSQCMVHSMTPPFEILSRPKRYVAYPDGTSSGLFLGLAFPLPLPRDGIIFSYIFEANYNLPDNVTQYFPPSPSEALKSFNRKFLYGILENKFTRAGLDGEECLLRLICDAALTPLDHNGLFGQILDILLRPSTTHEEELPDRIFEAERHGNEMNECNRIYPNCTIDLMDMFTLIEDSLESS